MEALTVEQQEHVDRLVGEARVKAREKAQADFTAAQNTASDAAAKARLAAEAKWQELAGQHEARVKELEPFEAQVKAYGTLVATMLKGRLTALGAAAVKAVGSLPDTMTLVEQLNWLNANEGLFTADSTGVGTPRRGAKPTGTGKVKEPYEIPLRL